MMKQWHFKDNARCKEVFCLCFIARRLRLKLLPKRLKQQWHIDSAFRCNTLLRVKIWDEEDLDKDYFHKQSQWCLGETWASSKNGGLLNDIVFRDGIIGPRKKTTVGVMECDIMLCVITCDNSSVWKRRRAVWPIRHRTEKKWE